MKWIKNEWVQTLANKIVGEWIKCYEYKTWSTKNKSFELDNEGGSGIIGTLQI